MAVPSSHSGGKCQASGEHMHMQGCEHPQTMEMAPAYFVN